uniref:Uncharacterized protein n=1 Tax=Anguilla anguilla TaxID=7936 RepID=A0A0E9QWZ4_ANGAN
MQFTWATYREAGFTKCKYLANSVILLPEITLRHLHDRTQNRIYRNVIFF